MVELFVTIAIVLYCFTKTVFTRSPQSSAPPVPSLEDQLNGILAQYLSQGVKLKIEKDR
ncbi:MAG: hypothetical protein O3A14_13445 [Cyanobacteria bacterium]|nr:hypothetical protein [Cyanobacteriota bacterium]